MATNKHAQIRYLALDKCFRNYGRKYYIEDLVEECNKSIYEFTGKEDGVRKRQVYEDINFIESSSGWSAEIERIKDGRKVYFRYADKDFSISKQPLNETEVNQINEVLFTLSRFKGLPQFEWIEEISSRLSTITTNDNNFSIINFEQNQFLKGLDFITPLFNAIIYKRTLKITYLSFKDEFETEYTIHPYYLKQYNLRWFLFGWNSSKKVLMNLALDRIIGLKETALTYVENKKIDFNEYFDDIIGVTIPENKIVEKISILIQKDLWPYIKTKPIHGSQKVKSIDEVCVEIELKLMINYELISLLLSFGERIKVIAPESLKNAIIKTSRSIIEIYK